MTRSACLFAALACAEAVAAAGPGEIERLLNSRTPENPRPLPFGEPPPKRGRADLARMAPVVDSVIREDFPCNDDTAGGCPQNGPRVAVDASGRAAVCWYDFRDSNADAWYQLLDSGGRRIDSNIELNTDVSMGWQGDPAGAFGPDDGLVFSWEDRREIGNSDIFCQRLDSAGSRLGDNFRVSDSGAAGDQMVSDVAVNVDRVSLVVWDDRRNGITGDIFAQFLNPDGSRMGGNFKVNSDPPGLANQYDPEVGTDDSGRFVVAWMDGRGHNAYDWNVFAQRYDRQGRTLGTNLQVTTDDSIQWAPAIGVSQSGRFAVCWDDRRRGGQWDVYAQFYDAQAQPAGENVRLNDDAGSADQYGTGVAANRFDEFLVVWTDRRNGNEDIYARRYGSDGNPVGPSFRVNADAGTANQGAPHAAASPDGGYWVAWADARDGNLDIYCQRLSRDCQPVGGNARINDDRGSSHQRVSSIGMDSRGYTCVAWEDERHGQTDIYRCILDPAGQTVGANVRLNDDGPGGFAQYYAAVAGGRERFFSAWVDGRAGWDIFAQFMDGAGLPAGPNFIVNTDPGTGSQWYPYAAMDKANNTLVTWQDTRSDRYQVFCRLYDPSGNARGPEFAVSDVDTADGIYASVAVNRNGSRAVVAWMDYREGRANAYCQLLRGDGSRVGTNIRCNSDSGGAYHGYPACAVAENGNIVVAWEDLREGNYDIYLQWFDSTAQRLGGNERVNDDAGTSDCYSPTCAFSQDGKLALMFNDEREVPGNPQIYCQRYRPDRTRIGQNRQVNAPNRFPKEVHWTVAQSVAANDDAIAFAWTCNTRLRGWDIFAKLTDWNLVGVSGPAAEPRALQGTSPTMVARGSGAIEFQSRRVRTGQVRLFDTGGRLRSRSTFVNGRCLLGVRGLAAGAYFVVAGDGDTTERSKIVLR